MGSLHTSGLRVDFVVTGECARIAQLQRDLPAGLAWGRGARWGPRSGARELWEFASPGSGGRTLML